MNRSVCWCITPRCNELCKFCYRISNTSERSLEENLYVLSKIKELGISEITYSGGEALLYPYLIPLMEQTKKYGIKVKLITNGRALTNELIDKLDGIVDEVTLSFDAVNDNIHNEMGRGIDHGKNVVRILDYIKNNNKKIIPKINTLVSRANSKEITKIAEFLSDYNIKRWKLFRFQSLRGSSIHYEDMFEISNQKFYEIIDEIKALNTGIKIVTRNTKEIEELYLNITSSGDFLITDDYQDKLICDYENIDIEKIKKVLETSDEL